MKNKNTMEMGAFLGEHLWWLFVAMVCFRSVGFRILAGATMAYSKSVLWGLVIVLTAVGFLLTRKRRRNNLSVAVNLCIPFGIYALLSTWPYIRRFAAVVGIVCVVLVAGYLLLMVRALRAGRFLCRLTTVFLGVRTILAGGLLIIALSLCATGAFGLPLFQASVPAQMPDIEAGPTIADRASRLFPLVDGTWDELSVEDKVDVLQELANLEASELGLGHELVVGADVLDGEMAAYYCDATRQIVIDIEYLKCDPDDLMETVAHEAHHAYAHRLVELFDAAPEQTKSLGVMQKARKYKEELADYKDLQDDDFEAYYTQSVEEDARIHGKIAAETYALQLWGYLPAV